MILLCEGTHPREVLLIHRPPSPNETKKTNTENIPLSVSVPDDAVCLLWLSADMHLSTSGFACAGGIYCPFQNFRVFIPVIRELFLSNASSDAGRHPRFPGYPLAFLPSCQSVHSLGRKARNQLCITAALVRQFSFS